MHLILVSNVEGGDTPEGVMITGAPGDEAFMLRLTTNLLLRAEGEEQHLIRQLHHEALGEEEGGGEEAVGVVWR